MLCKTVAVHRRWSLQMFAEDELVWSPLSTFQDQTCGFCIHSHTTYLNLSFLSKKTPGPQAPPPEHSQPLLWQVLSHHSPLCSQMSLLTLRELLSAIAKAGIVFICQFRRSKCLKPLRLSMVGVI